MNERYQNFENLKRSFETAYLAGEDYTELLYILAKTIVLSCVNKCVQVGALDQTQYISIKRQLDSKNSQTGWDSPFSEGMELMQETVCLLLEQASAHGSAEGWLDKPYTTRIIMSRARIREADSKGYQEKTTTPLQACYRTVRRAIEKMQCVSEKRDHVSLDSLEPSQQEALLADRTSEDELKPSKYGDYDELLNALKLTVRQEQILNLKMQGYGYQAIATYLGVSKSTVTRTLDRIKERCKSIGFVP